MSTRCCLRYEASYDFESWPHPRRAELPGIEPATKIAVTCGNAYYGDAERRETP
jgi:hypothetical protein